MNSDLFKTVRNAVKLLLLIYLFLLSISLMQGGFKLFGTGLAEALFATTANPIVALCIGVLATSLVQSSSATNSAIVGMVAAGALDLRHAIPMIMGANIGTTITNTIVSIANITRSQEYERSISAAVVHDYFNILVVIVLLPLEMTFHILEKLAIASVGIFQNIGGVEAASPIKAIVNPVSKGIIHGLENIFDNGSTMLPVACLVVAAVCLFIALRYLVSTLKSIMIGRVERLVHNYLFVNKGRALLLGVVITILVQSSSITTSLAVPMVAGGILMLEQIFPFTLGANIGTTITAILASLVFKEAAAMQVALAHMWFNIIGTAIFLPLQSIPIAMARKSATLFVRHKWAIIIYIAVLFFGIPILLIIMLG